MQIQTLTVGPVATSCYLVSMENSPACLVIDPGDEPSRILKAAGDRHIAAILLTHGHFDHIAAVPALLAASPDTPVLIHSLDAPMLANPVLNASQVLLAHPVIVRATPEFLRDGDRRLLAGLSVEVLHTPGHTPGSVCFLIRPESDEDSPDPDQHLFTGDTLFRDGWGRTDLPGGSSRDLSASLRKIVPLARTLPFYPGH